MQTLRFHTVCLASLMSRTATKQFSFPRLFHVLPRTLEYTFTTYSLGKESIQGALALYRVLPRALDMMRYRIIHSDVEFLIKCMRRICELLFTFQILCLNKPTTYCVSLFWKCLYAAVNNYDSPITCYSQNTSKIHCVTHNINVIVSIMHDYISWYFLLQLLSAQYAKS